MGIGFQFTKNINSQIVDDFKIITENTILNDPQPQYISNSIRMYDLNEVKPYLYGFETNVEYSKYLKKNKNSLIKHLKNMFK